MKIVTLLVAAAIGSGYGAAEASDPQITAIAFQRCTAKMKCSRITRWSETPQASPPRAIRVVATIANSSNYSDEFFLLTTTEYMIAPLYAHSVADFEKLKTGNEVSWSQLTKDDDMRAFVLHGLHREATRAITLRMLNLQEVLRNSFSEPDALWPWLVRVTAILINRQGQAVSTQSGILELAPSAERATASRDRPEHR
jgi:hypothetical protein